MSDDVGDRDKVRDKRRDAKLHEHEEGEALTVGLACFARFGPRNDRAEFETYTNPHSL